MAQLLFFDSNHTYELDGQKLTSVSEIIRFISKEIYGDINQFTLDNAASRGSAVHKALEVLDKYKEVEADTEIEPYIRAYLKFLKEHIVEWQYIEKSLASANLGVAGTIDRIGTIDGDLCILDLKTNSVIKKPLVKSQLNGYLKLAEENEIKGITKLYCLQLKNDGTYSLYPCDIDDTEFNCCLTLHNALQKKSKRGVIN